MIVVATKTDQNVTLIVDLTNGLVKTEGLDTIACIVRASSHMLIENTQYAPYWKMVCIVRGTAT